MGEKKDSGRKRKRKPPVPGRKPGRPKADIDPVKLRKLAEIHCTVDEIAAVMGCSKDTLERRFAAVIREGKEQGKMSLRRLQWKRAQAGSDKMLIWLGKQLLGQKDRHELSGDPNAPIGATGVAIIPSGSPPEDWAAIAARQQQELRDRIAKGVGA